MYNRNGFQAIEGYVTVVKADIDRGQSFLRGYMEPEELASAQSNAEMADAVFRKFPDLDKNVTDGTPEGDIPESDTHYRDKIVTSNHHRPNGALGFASRLARSPYVDSIFIGRNVGSVKGTRMKMRGDGLDIIYANDNHGVRLSVKTTGRTDKQREYISRKLMERFGLSCAA